jgi:hypothetical protein
MFKAEPNFVNESRFAQLRFVSFSITRENFSIRLSAEAKKAAARAPNNRLS